MVHLSCVNNAFKETVFEFAKNIGIFWQKNPKSLLLACGAYNHYVEKVVPRPIETRDKIIETLLMCGANICINENIYDDS